MKHVLITFVLQRRKLSLREITVYAQALQLVSCRVKIQTHPLTPIAVCLNTVLQGFTSIIAYCILLCIMLTFLSKVLREK